MKKYQYLNEKFSHAVLSLAISTDSLQDRLADAFVQDICYIKSQEIPEEIREKFDLLCKIFASEQSVLIAARKLATEEATLLIEDIVYMAEIIRREFHQV